MTSSPSDTSDPFSEEERFHLQERLRLFAKVVFVLGAAFLVIPFVLITLLTSYQEALEGFVTLRRLPQVVLTAGIGAGWALLTRVRMTRAWLRATDAGIQVFCAAMVLVLSALQSTGTVGGLSLALAIGHFLVLRSVIVPSSGRRTFWLGAILAAATAGAFWLLAVYRPHLLEFERPSSPVHGVLNLAIWLVFAVLSSTIASHVIFGLRAEVRQARKIGQYELHRQIGEGAMGIVYEATHAMLRRRTAIKLVLPHKVDRTTLARFEREVRQTARLTHPNTISVYDYGRTPDGIFYYAMELLEGIDLQRLVDRFGPLPAARVVHVLRQVLSSLREAHESGLIHRDIKPANVMLTQRGGESDVVKVLDFGLVKQIDDAVDPSLTARRAIAGTPMHMSPEAIQAPDTVGPASDLYAVAAVGYFLLTGTEVYSGSSVIEVCAKHLHAEPEHPSQRCGQPVPETLAALLLRGLEKKPELRPASAQAFLDGLSSCDVPPWSDADAEAWWRDHRDRLREAAGPVPDATRGTLPIDLGGR